MHVDTDSQKLKADQKNFGWAWSKMGHETLKLTESQKLTVGINFFFACWYKFRKAESWFNDFCVGGVKNVHGLLAHDTLKFTLSQEWIFELSWFFECW